MEQFAQNIKDLEVTTVGSSSLLLLTKKLQLVVKFVSRRKFAGTLAGVSGTKAHITSLTVKKLVN